MAPGKFESSGDVGEALYEMSMDGCDEELGDVQGFGWYGLLLDIDQDAGPEGTPKHAIVSEDSQGFWDVIEEFESADAARRAWKLIEDSYEEFEKGVE